MNKRTVFFGSFLILLTLMVFSCGKMVDKLIDKVGDKYGIDGDCYTCTDCQGQYGHMLNGDKCVEDFDDRADWLEHKEIMEEEGCNCE